MSKSVHRPVTDIERAIIPGAYSFNRASDTFHNRDGYPINVPIEVLSQLITSRRKRGKR